MILFTGQPPVEVLSPTWAPEDVIHWEKDEHGYRTKLMIQTDLMGLNWPYPLVFAGATMVAVKGEDGGISFYEVPYR